MLKEQIEAALVQVLAGEAGKVVVLFPGREDLVIWRKGTKVLLTPTRKGSTLSTGKGPKGAD